jgi:hypothetical protein
LLSVFSAERNERALSEPRRNAASAISGSQQSEPFGFMSIFFSLVLSFEKIKKKEFSEILLFFYVKNFCFYGVNIYL